MLDEPNSLEALRVLEICHSCRYCEGYCDTFGALGRLPILGTGDVAHLANLCHDCRACFQACPYTPLHEFAVNVPQALSAVRADVYEAYGGPVLPGRIIRGGKRGFAALAMLWILALLVEVVARSGLAGLVPGAKHGDFYAVVPAGVMISFGLATGVISVVLVTLGQRRFWADVYPDGRMSWRIWWGALRRAALLSGMRGGGEGCYYPDADKPSGLRRWLHSITAFGFLVTFAATCAAAVEEHVLHQQPPYGPLTVPVVLGTVGGAMILVGTGALFFVRRRSDSRLRDERAGDLDYTLLATLFLVAGTGMALLLFRGTRAMTPLLVVHLGVVGAFLVFLPYGKMVHAVFRFSALLRDELEQNRQPSAGDRRQPISPEAGDAAAAVAEPIA